MDTSSNIRNILFPTDFTKLSNNALTTAIAMCKRHNATLHLLHVVENRFLVIPRDAYNAAVYLLPELEKTAMERLTELSEKIRTTDSVNVLIHLEFSNPADAIREKAIGLGCDLIVMGTHGASGFREFFIGSNAYAVIKNTTVPVLTVPGTRKVKEFKKIIFPIRAASGIIDKFDFIEPIIEKNKAELVILGLSLRDEIFNPAERKATTIELGRRLHLAETAYKSAFYVCKNYAKKVLEIARKEKADLIVINASLDYKWRQFFIGPYTQQVVNHAKIPVLSIRMSDEGGSLEDAVKEENCSVL
jgi:nucleotide-binding universal stress UspA family protein